MANPVFDPPPKNFFLVTVHREFFTKFGQKWICESFLPAIFARPLDQKSLTAKVGSDDVSTCVSILTRFELV
jgi:hypothetical protein